MSIITDQKSIIISITLVETHTRIPHIKFETNWSINLEEIAFEQKVYDYNDYNDYSADGRRNNWV